MGQHARLQTVAVADNRLVVAGRPISDYITADVPHYIYAKDEIDQRIHMLRTALPGIHLHYAIKANAMPEVVAHIAPQTDGLDVASVAEMNLALQYSDPGSISFAGPAKQLGELQAAIAAGVVINVESPTELSRIVSLAAAVDAVAKVALRINPDFELKQSGMQMAGGAKPFGIDAETVGDLLPLISTSHVQLVGFHIFAGSQNLSAASLIDAQNQTLNLAQLLVDKVVASGKGDDLQHVNIGGGFGIPYFMGQQYLEVDAVATALHDRLQQCTGKLAELDIVMELGRYIVGEAGYYVCQVTDIKHSRGTDYLMVNGGMHHHLANSGNFGQVIRKNYPVVLADNVSADTLYRYDVAGPLCTPLDIVAAKLDLPKAEIGDYLVVLQSGAYGFSASPQLFLSHPAPIQRLI